MGEHDAAAAIPKPAVAFRQARGASLSPTVIPALDEVVESFRRRSAAPNFTATRTYGRCRLGMENAATLGGDELRPDGPRTQPVAELGAECCWNQLRTEDRRGRGRSGRSRARCSWIQRHFSYRRRKRASRSARYRSYALRARFGLRPPELGEVAGAGGRAGMRFHGISRKAGALIAL